MLEKHVHNNREAIQTGEALLMALVSRPYSERLIHDGIMKYRGSDPELLSWIDKLFRVHLFYWPQRNIVAAEGEGVLKDLLKTHGFSEAPDLDRVGVEELTFGLTSMVQKVVLSATAIRYLEKWRRGMLQLLRDINQERGDVL